MFEVAVRDVVERYIATLNAKNVEALSTVLHFPHFRIMPDGVTHNWTTPQEFWSWFQNRVSSDGWDHTILDNVSVNELTSQKYHAEVTFGRYRLDSSLISSYYSLYVITFENRIWGIKAGSGTG